MDLAIPFISHLTAVAILFLGQHTPGKQKRIFILPATLLFLQALYQSRYISATSVLRGPFAMTQVIGILNIPFILATPISEVDSPICRLKLAAKTIYNPRMLPITKMAPVTEKKQISMGTFLKTSGIRFLDLITLDIISSILTTMTLMSCTEDDFSPEQVPIICRVLDGSVTLNELQLRLFISTSWLFSSYITLNLLHVLLSIFFVAFLRIDHPDEWPPLFGNLSDAYSLQRFWGKTWHRLFSCAAVIWARKGLGLFVNPNKWPKLQTFLTAFLVFTLSGMAHMLVAMNQNEPKPYLDLLFFWANFLGIVLEILTAKVGKRVRFLVWGYGSEMRTKLKEQRLES